LNRALKYLPQGTASLLAQIFNAVLRTTHFPTVWKHARVISILKPGKDPALPSFYWPISLLDTIGKLFEKILLTRILCEVSERGLKRDEGFGFQPRQSTPLQLAHLVERITRNFGEKRLTGVGFLDVAIDTVWTDGLLYKRTLLNVSSYTVITNSSYLRCRSSKRPSRWPRHLIAASRLEWLGVDLPCHLQSVCQGHAITLAPHRHGHRSHVPQADASRHLPRVIPQRPSTVVE
jgi:hypothetical protein